MQGGHRAGSEASMFRAAATSVILRSSQVVVYEITEQDLDFFASGMRPTFTGLATFGLGVFVAVGPLLLLNRDTAQQMEIIIMALITGAGATAGLIFGSLAGVEFWRHGRRLRKFKKDARPQEVSATPEHGTAAEVVHDLRPAPSIRMRRPDSR